MVPNNKRRKQTKAAKYIVKPDQQCIAMLPPLNKEFTLKTSRHILTLPQTRILESFRN